VFEDLIGKYTGKDALVIMGGPSVFDFFELLKQANTKKFVVFLEPNSLTPKFLTLGIKPDYLLAPFPEKCKDNSLQHYVYRSFLASIRIRGYLKNTFKLVADEMWEKFDQFFEIWRPHKGAHKKYRYKPGIYMKDSPYDLLRYLPETNVITNRQLLEEHYPEHDFPNPLHFIRQNEELKTFELEKYYNPKVYNGELILSYVPFINSVAIATYPIMNAMGFNRVYLLGMDMSMLGSMEYAAPFIFKSMFHFRWFFEKANRVFNADYKMNRPYYFRPKSEFEDLRQVLNYPNINIIRVYKDYRYAAPVDGIRTITPEELFCE
jgi:hypothetical protein